MNKEFLTWLCGIISTDGNVQCNYLLDSKSQKRYKGGNVTIFTSEIDWANQITTKLTENNLSFHLLEVHKERPQISNGRWKTELRIDIHKHNPVRHKNGRNQWLEIVDGIKAFSLKEYIMGRKYVELQKIANL